jgi:hypothetical protein
MFGPQTLARSETGTQVSCEVTEEADGTTLPRELCPPFSVYRSPLAFGEINLPIVIYPFPVLAFLGLDELDLSV